MPSWRKCNSIDDRINASFGTNRQYMGGINEL